MIWFGSGPLRTLVLFGAALLLSASVGIVQPAQEIPAPTPIRVETVLINVPVIVTDREGRSIPALKKEDFSLLDDGKPQAISLFAASEEPVNVALLLDTSKSTVTVLGKIRKAARSFVRQMRPRDRVLVLAFDREITLVNPLSDDPADLERSIREVKPGTYVGTRLRDALFEVTAKRFRGITGRKAVVLLSDGQDYGSAVSIPDLLASVAESGTLVYSIFYTADLRALSRQLFGVSLPRRLSGGLWQQRQEEAARFLKELSELSAGRWLPSEISDLNLAFGRIVGELRNQYMLGYYPEASRLDGAAHNLTVSVRRADAIVRARPGYRILRSR